MPGHNRTRWVIWRDRLDLPKLDDFNFLLQGSCVTFYLFSYGKATTGRLIKLRRSNWTKILGRHLDWEPRPLLDAPGILAGVQDH